MVSLAEIQRINSVDQCLSNINVHTSHLGLVKNAHPDSVGLWQDLRFCLHKPPDDASVTGPGASLKGQNVADLSRRSQMMS